VPLLIAENYVNHRPRVAGAGGEAVRLRVLAKCAEGVSAGDVASRRVRQAQAWALMPFAAALGAVYPAAYARGQRETFGLYPGEPNFPRFSAWLGQNSSSGKQRRLLGELHTRMLSSGALAADRTALRLAYLPTLRAALAAPLLARGKEGIPDALTLMHDYCLAREDVDFIGDVCKFKTARPWGVDPFKGLDTQTKSAFTRAFNQEAGRPKTGFGMEDAKKKRGGAKGAAAAAADAEDEDEGGLRGEGEGGSAAAAEEEEELDPAVVRRQLMGMRAQGMAVTLKDGSTAAAGRGAKKAPAKKAPAKPRAKKAPAVKE
jgi:replication factor C subunit 1